VKRKNIVSIIGAGAAGCFCAIELKRRRPELDVHVYERATKPLAKVAITGGGRCNLTNSFSGFTDERGAYHDLHLLYPRGDKLMRRMLSQFSHTDTMEWFEHEGVRLVTQRDNCVFPQSQDAMEIVYTLLRLMRSEGVALHLKHELKNIEFCDEMGYKLLFNDEEKPISSDIVIITTGGGKAPFLQPLGIEIVPTLPSLFTFNTANAMHNELMGTVVENVTLSFAGTRLRSHGEILITHWGVSGPAVLKLSSYAARLLAETDYRGTLIINWCDGRNAAEVTEEISHFIENDSHRQVNNTYPSYLTNRLWLKLLEVCSIPHTQRWGALNQTHINRLVNTLTGQQVEVTGRCKYKDEFVTCGGVSLKEVNPKTLEHRNHAGLFFAGEALDIDAITGGFNLQAAWSTAMCVARSI
jgi:predicted Rossmann fold flavoprotein